MSKPLEEALAPILAASRALVAMSITTLAADLPDITLQQFRVLGVLELRGALRPSDLSIELAISAATAGRIVKRLADAGLAERYKDPDDARCVLAAISPKGSALVERMTDRRRAAFAYALKDLTPEELGTLAPVFARFTQALGGSPDLARAQGRSGR